MRTLKQMLAQTPTDTACQWVFDYWDKPTTFYNILNGWVYEAALRLRKAEINSILEIKMAGKNPKQSQAQEKATWGGYKQIDLTDAQMKRLDKDVESGNVNVLECLDRLLSIGKVTFNQREGSVSCTLTVEHAGQLWSLSAFSDLSWEAILLLAEKNTSQPAWYKDDIGTQKRRRG